MFHFFIKMFHVTYLRNGETFLFMSYYGLYLFLPKIKMYNFLFKFNSRWKTLVKSQSLHA